MKLDSSKEGNCSAAQDDKKCTNNAANTSTGVESLPSTSGYLSLDKSQSPKQKNRRSRNNDNEDKSPTSTCPTIASALWRPLWPPGWHPRGSPSPHSAPQAPATPGTKSATPSLRPTSFLSKYTRPPLITMSEPTDEGGGSPRANPPRRGKCVDSAHDNPIPEETVTPVEEHEHMEAWLDEHPQFLRNYFVRKASRSVVDAWLLAHSVPPGVSQVASTSTSAPASGATTPVRKISATEFEKGSLFLRPIVSTTADGIPSFLPIPPVEGSSPLESPRGPRRKTRKELEALDEKLLIFELVKDICSMNCSSSSEEEFDPVNSLCHKILQNISILTNGDRASLFLVKGEKTDPQRHFVSTLFDVCSESTLEQQERAEAIRVPWGTGIVGFVASTGDSVHIPDCYSDDRFSDLVDKKTGYRTRNMLCSPIYDIFGEVMGVAQVINKNARRASTLSTALDDEYETSAFTAKDIDVFNHYLQFCGIGLRNAQLFERSHLENKRNQVLLDLARMVFEEQSTIEHIVYRIMVHIQSLLECERCQVLLVAEDKSGSPYRSFARVFDLERDDLDPETDPNCEARQSPFEGRFPINIGITGFVATTGRTLNIPDAYSDTRFDHQVDDDHPRGFKHRSILCMPIRNAERKIIGVSQLINKISGAPFNKNDEDLFEVRSAFDSSSFFCLLVSGSSCQTSRSYLMSLVVVAIDMVVGVYGLAFCLLRFFSCSSFVPVLSFYVMDCRRNR